MFTQTQESIIFATDECVCTTAVASRFFYYFISIRFFKCLPHSNYGFKYGLEIVARQERVRVYFALLHHDKLGFTFSRIRIESFIIIIFSFGFRIQFVYRLQRNCMGVEICVYISFAIIWKFVVVVFFAAYIRQYSQRHFTVKHFFVCVPVLIYCSFRFIVDWLKIGK